MRAVIVALLLLAACGPADGPRCGDLMCPDDPEGRRYCDLDETTCHCVCTVQR